MQRLVAAEEVVLDVPSKKSSLVRAFSATSGRKSDEVDAHAVAFRRLYTNGEPRSNTPVSRRSWMSARTRSESSSTRRRSAAASGP